MVWFAFAWLMMINFYRVMNIGRSNKPFLEM